MEKSESLFSSFSRSYNQNQFPNLKRSNQCMQDLCRKYGKTFPDNRPYTGGEDICLLEDRPRITSEMLENLRARCMALKLKKIMAVEIMKNHVKGNLKQIVKQIDTHSKPGSKDFVIIGGGHKSLNYATKKLHENSLASGFILKIDVRGYIPSNIIVDTDNNHMSIKATKVNGSEKMLSLFAPSTMALDRVKIYPPNKGFLLLKCPSG